MKILASLREWYEEDKRQALTFGVSALALALSFFDVRLRQLDPAWLTVLLCGVPIVRGAVEGLAHALAAEYAGAGVDVRCVSPAQLPGLF